LGNKKKPKVQLSNKLRIQMLGERCRKLLNQLSELKAAAANILNKWKIQKEKNRRLMSDAPDLHDLDREGEPPVGDYFIKKGPAGWLVRDGAIVSCFRMTDDGIVEQIDVVKEAISLPTERIKAIMEGA